MKVTKLEHVVETLAVIINRWDSGTMDLRMLRDELRELGQLAARCRVSEAREAAQANMVAVIEWLSGEISGHVDEVPTRAANEAGLTIESRM